MKTAYETFEHALHLHKASRDRIGELEKAVQALTADPTVDSDYGRHPQFVISVRHLANDVCVDISVSPDFLRPLVEAALVTERESFVRMDSKLSAARKTLQQA